MNPSDKGYVSMDGLFSILPAMLILILALDMASHIAREGAGRMHGQELFDKLVSIADYTVKAGAAKTDQKQGLRYPNLIDESRLTQSYADGLASRAGLDALSITLDTPGNGAVCIYRVVVDANMDVRQLHVCGG